ncbi:cytidine deaminase [Pseudidiomarina sp.]|uniref:cytidine deaminase n=1 Tax=Pseudidiomarina sp. TaxID=2081707 RepID=UPI00299E5C0A|nr:cytidine deaminase [Pseudidiomarina sp.]MDX1706233.1 cytidine deaminase [Pseudidiomarina sp.]
MTKQIQNDASAHLKQQAKLASERAYAPFSNFPVGAALELNNGEIITGCNVENSSYGLSNCAERTAIFTAIAQGYKGADIRSVTIYIPGAEAVAPCGACRQVLAEFLASDTPIFSTSDGQERQWQMKELLPDAFSFNVATHRK